MWKFSHCARKPFAGVLQGNDPQVWKLLSEFCPAWKQSEILPSLNWNSERGGGGGNFNLFQKWCVDCPHCSFNFQQNRVRCVFCCTLCQQLSVNFNKTELSNQNKPFTIFLSHCREHTSQSFSVIWHQSEHFLKAETLSMSFSQMLFVVWKIWVMAKKFCCYHCKQLDLMLQTWKKKKSWKTSQALVQFKTVLLSVSTTVHFIWS